MIQRLRDRATWLTNLAQLRGHALLIEAFQAAGSTGYSYRVLAALDEIGPASQAEVGRQVGMDRSDITATVDRLTAAGLATRGAHPADARKNLVGITDAGRAELARLDRVLTEVQQRYLAPLSPWERTTFIRLLGKLV